MTLNVEQFRKQFFQDAMIFSWMQLEEFFTNFSAGVGKFILKKNKTDNVRNGLTMYVRWGAPAGHPAVAGIGNSVATHQANEPSWAMMFQLQEKNNQRTQELMKELMESQFQLQLRDTLAELGGTEEPTLQERVIEIGTQIASAYLLGGSSPQLPGQLGTLGEDGRLQQNPAPAAAPTSTPSQEQPAPPTERPVSYDQMNRAAEMVRASVPYHPNDVFAAIALFCQNQPDQASNYIGMLINQVKQSAATKPAENVG